MMFHKSTPLLSDTILAQLEGVRGTELIRLLSTILAQQEQRIETLENNLELLTLHERHRGPMLAADGPVRAMIQRFSRLHEISANDYLLERNGFHGIEFDRTGRPYRWCGASGLVPFSFYVDRKDPLELVLTLFNSVDERNYSDMKLFDGEAEVKPVDLSGESGGARTLIYHLPGRPDVINTQITLKCPVFIRLSSDDERVAAIAFHNLAVSPIKSHRAV
jgi:hypothetical protein